MISYASYTDAGGRTCNEDTVGFRRGDGERLCVVAADGLGGHGGGQTASEAAAELILEGISEGWRGADMCAALNGLVLAAHRRVLSLQTPFCKMKTTAVVLSLEPGRAAWVHAGDSRLYHFVDGGLAFQTRDHSISQVAVMMNQIRQEEVRFHEDRSHIFRALGQEGDLSVNAREEALKPGRHAFLLCTDGFWEYVYEEEMERELAVSASPEEWLGRMRRLLESRVDGGNDNNTAAAVWMDVD